MTDSHVEILRHCAEVRACCRERVYRAVDDMQRCVVATRRDIAVSYEVRARANALLALCAGAQIGESEGAR